MKYLWISVLLFSFISAGAAETAMNQPILADLKATATSSWQDHLPQNAFDGKPETYWQGTGDGDTLEARFAPVTVNQITTVLNPDLIMDAELFILPSDVPGENWQSVSRVSKFGGKKWVADFERQSIRGIKTQISRCAHRSSPDKRGEWVFVLDQIPESVAASREFPVNLPVAPIALKPAGEVVIDGAPDEAVWREATQIANFTWEGARVNDDSTLFLLADEDNFYVAGNLAAEHPEAIKIAGVEESHPLAIWGGDVLELFFAPFDTPAEYIQVVFGAGGNHKLMTERPDTIRSAARITSEGWSFEACIPWQAVGLDGLEDLPIRFNAARDNRSRPELSSWGPLYGGFHKPNFFGILLPPPESEPPRVGTMEWDGGGYCSVPVSGGGRLIWRNVNSNQVVATVSPGETASGAVRLPVPPLPFTGQLELLGADGEVQYRNSAVRFEQDRYRAGISKLATLLKQLPESEARNFSQRIPDPVPKAELGEWLAEVARKRLELADPDGVVAGISAMTKVLPQPLFSDEWHGEIDLSTARREYENFQILLSAPLRELAVKGVAVSELRSSSGEIFPGKFRFYRVGNVKSPERDLPTALPGGLYPDPLFPFGPFTVPAGQNGAVWGEVFTPPETVPGKYSGTVTVTRTPGDEVTLPIHITVYSATLPVERSLATPFIIDRPVLADRFGYAQDSPEHLAQIEAYRQANAEHRLDWLFCPGGMHETAYPRCIWDGKKLTWDFTEFDRIIEKGFSEGMYAFSVGFSWAHLPPIVDLEGNAIPESSQPFNLVRRDHPELADAMTAAWREYAQHLREKNWLNRSFYYVADEPIPEHYAAVREQANALLNADGEFQTMLTIMNPAAFGDIIRIWCPNLAFFDPDLAAQELAKGKQVWWYVCIGSARPNYYVDFPAIDPRIHFWLTYRYKLTGVLYWRVNCWPAGKDVAAEAHDFGDGYLYYPDEAGPIPSIRIKMVRDGAEDYELLKLLEARDPACELLRLETWCPNTMDYPLDPRELEKRRIQILRRLDALQQ